ncbi:MAG: cyclic nucleotide-binding domain-containing protein [Rickettsiales bacterium]|nr:cyclic nucleotide-binding domain-containing protein [Rickettsiales bacterium]
MLEEQTFQHGELIFREGEESDFAYLISEGSVEIFKRTERGTVLLSNLGSGELFGEMGLISDTPRSASAAADGPIVVKKISRDALHHLLGQSPAEIAQMLKALMERLRSGNQKISRLLNKQNQFQLATSAAHEVKRISLIPLSNQLKEQLGKGTVIQAPYRVGSGSAGNVGMGESLDMNDLEIKGANENILSRSHFCVQKGAQGLEVVDRGSRTGTIVNDIPIGSMHESDSAVLTPGDNTIIAGDAASPYRFCINWEIE